MPENVIGLLPDIGFAHLAKRIPGGIGIFMALSGGRISNPSDLLYTGIGSHYISTERLPELKKALYSDDISDVASLLSQYAAEPPGPAPLLQLQPYIDRCFLAKDSVGAVYDALEGEQAVQEIGWDPQQVVKGMEGGAPSTLSVTLEHYNRVCRASDSDPLSTIQGVLRAEHRICVHCCRDAPDFVEGVRAALVDKDKNPSWQPRQLSEVSPEFVKKYFQPLANELEALFQPEA